MAPPASGARRRADSRARAHAVAVLARGQDGLDATVAEIEALGGRGLAIETDVADAAQVDARGRRGRARARADRRVDQQRDDDRRSAPVDAITPDEFQRVTAVCYLGFVWGTRAALARMRPRNRGTIIQVGSALAYRSIPLQAPYCAAKHAIRGFTDSLRSELLARPRRDRPVHGAAAGGQHAAVRLVPQQDRARAAAGAADLPARDRSPRRSTRSSQHPRREVFLGAPAIKAIVGNKLAPGYADHYLANARLLGPAARRARRPRPAGQPVRAGRRRCRRARRVRRRARASTTWSRAPRPARRGRHAGGARGRRDRGARDDRRGDRRHGAGDRAALANHAAIATAAHASDAIANTTGAG